MLVDPITEAPRSSSLDLSPGSGRGCQREKTPPLGAIPGAEVNLASIDLNLLVALEALLLLRNVTHAGKRIGLSQPAMSRALSRLRALFKDDILVRTARGLTLTIRGEQLLDKLPGALGLLRTLMSGRDADAPHIRRKIIVAMQEHQAIVLLPHLLPRLLEKEPDLDLVLRGDLTDALRGLEDGSIDFMVGPRQEASSGFYTRTLYTDRAVCLLRSGHPVLEKNWSSESLRELRHAVLAGNIGPEFPSAGDETYNPQHDERSSLVVPSLSVAPSMIANTDLALLLPYRAARAVAMNASLVVKELPGELQEVETTLLWHERCHRDPRHRWIRAQFAAVALGA